MEAKKCLLFVILLPTKYFNNSIQNFIFDFLKRCCMLWSFQISGFFSNNISEIHIKIENSSIQGFKERKMKLDLKLVCERLQEWLKLKVFLSTNNRSFRAADLYLYLY